MLFKWQKRTLVKGKTATKKKSANKFIIDCSTAETDSILDVPDFVSFYDYFAHCLLCVCTSHLTNLILPRWSGELPEDQD
jgi:hypothetical protein